MTARLPDLDLGGLDDDVRELLDALIRSRGSGVVDEGGSAVGPFGAWLRVPRVGRHLAALGHALRFEATIPARLVEAAVITVAAHWRSEFEWWGHVSLARAAGVDEALIQAVGSSLPPPASSPADERLVYDVTKRLLAEGRVDDGPYSAFVDHFGTDGLVELVSLVGYYTLVSFTLNAFEVPPPDEVDRAWPGA